VFSLFSAIFFASGMCVISSSAPGEAGTIIVTAGFIYVCIATNTWRRIAIPTSTW